MENQPIFAKDVKVGNVLVGQGYGQTDVVVSGVELYPFSSDVEFVFLSFEGIKSRIPCYPMMVFTVAVVHDPAAEIEQMRKDDGVNIGYDCVPDLEELVGDEM